MSNENTHCSNCGSVLNYQPKYESVNHPKHYNSHPSGVEAITICENLDFNIGNAIKYLFRVGNKPGEQSIEAIKKSFFYIQREITAIQLDQVLRMNFYRMLDMQDFLTIQKVIDKDDSLLKPVLKTLFFELETSGEERLNKCLIILSSFLSGCV